MSTDGPASFLIRDGMKMVDGCLTVHSREAYQRTIDMLNGSYAAGYAQAEADIVALLHSLADKESIGGEQALAWAIPALCSKRTKPGDGL